MITSPSFLALEPRVLCSTTPITHEEPHPPAVVDPTLVAADKQAVLDAVAKLQSDFTAGSTALQAARATRDGHVAANAAQLKTLLVAVTADKAALAAVGPAAAARVKALYAKWAPIIGPEEQDVKTNTPGETDDERAADAAKLASDRAAAMAELAASTAQQKADCAAAQAQMKTDQAAVDAARKMAAAQLKVDAAAVSSAEKMLRTVFQTDRKIVDLDVAKYRKDGGSMTDLGLPVLPKM